MQAAEEEVQVMADQLMGQNGQAMHPVGSGLAVGTQARFEQAGGTQRAGEEE